MKATIARDTSVDLCRLAFSNAVTSSESDNTDESSSLSSSEYAACVRHCKHMTLHCACLMSALLIQIIISCCCLLNEVELFCSYMQRAVKLVSPKYTQKLSSHAYMHVDFFAPYFFFAKASFVAGAPYGGCCEEKSDEKK